MLPRSYEIIRAALLTLATLAALALLSVRL